jgi:hypothetical protein
MQIFDGLSGDARERLKLALMERKRDKWVKAAKSMWLARKIKLPCGCGSPPWTEAKRTGGAGAGQHALRNLHCTTPQITQQICGAEHLPMGLSE